MKKILLIFILLLTTGCYDYVELNSLSIISSIGIDYQNNEYILTLEILNDQASLESNNISSYDITINGKSITEAFENASVTLNKIPYYNHLKTIIISEEIALNHLDKIIDYFLRNPKMIHGFYLVMTKDTTPQELLNIKGENHLVIGNEIVSKMENNIYEYSISYPELFEDFLERLINKRKDALLTTYILENSNIKTYGIALFKENKLIDILDDKESALLNILLSNETNMSLENDELIVNIYTAKTDINFDKNITINVNAEAQIKDNKKENHLKKDESYIKFNKEFSRILRDDLTKLIKKINTLDIDPLMIKWKYYQKYKKDFKDIDINLNVSVIVNKKGLVFEVNHE